MFMGILCTGTKYICTIIFNINSFFKIVDDDGDRVVLEYLLVDLKLLKASDGLKNFSLN